MKHCIIQIYFIPDNFVERNYVFPPLISLSLCLSVCLFVCMMSQKVPVEFRLNYTSVPCRYCLNLAQLTRRGVMKRFLGSQTRLNPRYRCPIFYIRGLLIDIFNFGTKVHQERTTHFYMSMSPNFYNIPILRANRPTCCYVAQ